MPDLIKTWGELRTYLNALAEKGDSRLDEQIISQGEDGQIEPSALLDVWMDEIDDFRLSIVPIESID